MDYDIECVIKLGGSAITNKGDFETVKKEVICDAAKMVLDFWKHDLKFIVVHGAGSFGHHQAKHYEVNSGWTSEDRDISHVRTGFCKTRRSVTTLQQLIVDTFIEEGIPAIAQSPCGSWVTDNGTVSQSNVQGLKQLLESGFIPVIHGDCVLDRTKGCAILSGDTIIKEICNKLSVRQVVFLTDVDGVYTAPPGEADANLIRNIQVTSSGPFNIKMSSDMNKHDVTGGIIFKINSAADIVKETGGNSKVFICRINSDAARNACLYGDLKLEKGTLVSLEQNIK